MRRERNCKEARAQPERRVTGDRVREKSKRGERKK